MRIEHDPDVAALKRDWLGARIVGAAGVLLIVVVAGLAIAALLSRPSSTPAPSPQAQAAARTREDIALCNAALASVQALGVLPGFAVRDGDRTMPGGAQGRYSCNARTDAAHYRVTFELACTRLGASNCIVPLEVDQDGISVYRRK